MARAMPVSRSVSLPQLTAFLACRTAMGPLFAMTWAMSRALARAWPAGTRWFTRPMAWASAAGTRRPVKIISLASGAPTMRGSNCVPPMPGKIPRVTSGTAKTAVSEATMKSESTASSQPPPMAKPSTAAITGTGQWSTLAAAASKMACWSRHVSSVMPSRSFKSPPTQKALAPAPVKTTQRATLSHWKAAEQRRHAGHAGPLAVPAHGQPDGAVVWEPRMLGGDQHAARFGLGLPGHAVEGQDGRARHAGALEPRENLGAREPARDPRQRVDELGAMRDARGIVGEARIARQLGGAERGGRLDEERVGARGDHDPGIPRGEGLVRADHRGAGALRLRDLAGGEVVGHLKGGPGEGRLEERRRHVGATARALALAQGPQDGDDRPHARAHVHDGDGHARGRLPRVPIDGHEPAIGLHERIVPGPVAERSLRAEGRDRAVDEPWIDRLRTLPAEPQLLDGPRAERLDEDVGALDQALEDGAPVVRLHVHGQAPLAAVEAHE